jgi:[protein-PII] uridylyltransferase
MARAGASIVDAKIFTTTNGTALDTFWIQDARAGPLNDARRVARLKAAVTDVVADEGPLEPLVLEGGRLPSRTAVFTVEPRVLIDNRASDIYTVVEINGRDRPGLLYDLTRVLAGLRLSIASAHIATFGERAVDVFYVKDRFGLKMTREETFRQLRGALLHVLQAPPPGSVAARGFHRLARRSARVGAR